jgi:hypothetical protein
MGRNHLENLGIYGRIILNWILENVCENADCKEEAQNRVP